MKRNGILRYTGWAMTAKRNKKLSLEEAARKLAAITERHLSTLPEEEQNTRVAAFARVKFGTSRETRAKSSSSSRTRPSRAAGRAR
jgi:hypothetical protein